MLSVVYVIFTEGSTATAGDDLMRPDLAHEAVRLARVLARLRPHAGPRAWELARALLALPGVAQGGGLRDPETLPAGVGGAMERADEAFLRTGCCIFYRLPGHGLCPDCVLAQHHPERVTPAH